MNISQWKNGDRTFFSLEVDDRLLLPVSYDDSLGTVNLHEGSLTALVDTKTPPPRPGSLSLSSHKTKG